MQKKSKTARVAIVGEMLEIIRAKNQSLQGVCGTAIDETKNTIKIQTKNSIKTIIKDQVVIKIQEKTINGQELLGRIEGRLKQ